MVEPSWEAVQLLEKEGLSCGLINARFIKPLDIDLFQYISTKTKFMFTVEEGVLGGGFGSAVAEILNKPVHCLGLPSEFITHGKRTLLLEKYGLTAKGVVESIKKWLR
jgi:1-deoxy-D-xylulose-5-phosphate synthase